MFLGLIAIPVISVIICMSLIKTGTSKTLAANVLLISFIGLVFLHSYLFKVDSCPDCGLIYIYLVPFYLIFIAIAVIADLNFIITKIIKALKK